jgi:hypothetical protein
MFCSGFLGVRKVCDEGSINLRVDDSLLCPMMSTTKISTAMLSPLRGAALNAGGDRGGFLFGSGGDADIIGGSWTIDIFFCSLLDSP